MALKLCLNFNCTHRSKIMCQSAIPAVIRSRNLCNHSIMLNGGPGRQSNAGQYPAPPPKQFYVYLSTEGLDSFIRFAIVPAGILGSPWFYSFLRANNVAQGLNNIHVIMNYGMVLSGMKFARILGSDVLYHITFWRENHRFKEMLSFVLTILAIMLTFPGVGEHCIASLTIIFVMTAIGSLLSEIFCSNHQNIRAPVPNAVNGSTILMQTFQNHPAPSSNIFGSNGTRPNISTHNASPNYSSISYSAENKIRRNLIVYIFTTLATGYILFAKKSKGVVSDSFGFETLSSMAEKQVLEFVPSIASLPHEVSAVSIANTLPFMTFYIAVSSFSFLVFLYNVFIGYHSLPSNGPVKHYPGKGNDSISSQETLNGPHRSYVWPFSNSAYKSNYVSNVNGSNKSDEKETEMEASAIGSVPKNFIEACGGDEDKARAMYVKSLHWRKDNNVDQILAAPQKSFHDVLEHYPHAIHGRSLDGCIVLYEVLGRAKPKELVLKGITTTDMVWHFNLRNEFVFQRLGSAAAHAITTAATKNGKGDAQSSAASAGENSRNNASPPYVRIMTVCDVKGVSMGAITSDVISFIKQSSEVMDSYYPGHVQRLVICNAPSWFYSVWSVVARVLPASVQKKICITNGTSKLDEFIHPSQRPEEYGGTDVPLGQSKEHLEFLKLPLAWSQAESAVAVISTSDTPTAAAPHAKGISFGSSSSNTAESGHEIVSSEGSNANKRSVWGWIKAKFAPSASSGNIRPTNAFLGEKNMYKYDVETGTWTLDVSDSDSDGSSSPHSSSSSDDDYLTQTASKRIRNARKPKRSAPMHPSTPSPSELEEHALLLAIQAAHIAHMSNKPSDATAGKSSAAATAPAISAEGHHQRHLRNLHVHADSAPSHHHHDNHQVQQQQQPPLSPSHHSSSHSIAPSAGSGKGLLNSEPPTKLSTEVFLVVIGLYVLASCVHVALISVIPIWMEAPIDFGGGGFRVYDVAMLCSASAFLLLVADTFIRHRVVYILKASPLRALRIGCGTLVVASLLLPWFLRRPPDLSAIGRNYMGYLQHSFNLTDLAVPAGAASANLSVSSGHWLPMKTGLQLQHLLVQQPVVAEGQHGTVGEFSRIAKPSQGAQPYSRNLLELARSELIPAEASAGAAAALGVAADSIVSAESGTSVGAKTTDSEVVGFAAEEKLESMLYLPFPCIVMTVIVAATYLSRRASMVLLQIALAPVFAEPKGLVRIFSHTIDVLVPFLSCVIYSVIYDMNLPYPMNALSFISIAACIAAFLYVCTMLLDLRFRGDFGLAGEGEIDGLRNESGAVRDGCCELLSIPTADLQLLLSRPKVGYGSKLFNLKVDVKDV